MMMRTLPALLALAAGTLLGMPTPTAAAPAVKCSMTFQLSGWSVIYKASNGTGSIRCSNGQTMQVRLKARGGGLTVGKSTIDAGQGEFSSVGDIRELPGVYASAEAQAGAVKSAKAQVVTKGEVTLALSGTGRGWDLGVAVGSFEILRR